MAIFLKTVEKFRTAGVVLHQPLAAGPCGHFSRGLENGGFAPSGRGLEKASWEARGPPGNRETASARTGDRAPARGVDVKPPPRGTPGPAPGPRIGDPGIWALLGPLRQGSGTRIRRPPGPRSRGALPDRVRGARLGPSRPLGAPPGPGQARVLHQPLAAGPCPRPGAPVSGEVSEPRPGGPGLTA